MSCGLCCRCHAAPRRRAQSYCRPCLGLRQDERRAEEVPGKAQATFSVGLRVRVGCLPPVEGTVERVDVNRRLAWVGGVPFGWSELREVR